MTKTTKRQPEELDITTVETVMMFHTEVENGKPRRKPVLLIRIPVCLRTKRGFSETVENYVARQGIAVLRLSRSAVAIIPEKKFVSGQVEAVMQTVIRYRELEPDKIRIRRLPSSSSAAKKLRGEFNETLKKALNKAGAGAIPLQLAN